MLVKDVMTQAIKTARPETRIKDVAVLMCFNKIAGVPVVEADRRIVGIISEKDILIAMYPKMDDVMLGDAYPSLEELEYGYRDVLELTVGDLMAKRVVTVGPDEPLLRAAAVMFLQQIRRIPVAVDGRLVGIISLGDVHEAIFKETLDQQFASRAHARAETRADVHR